MSNRMRFRNKTNSACENSTGEPPALRQRVVALDQLPSRSRGESFDQKQRITYSFEKNSIVGCLLALHADRAIVVQIDVAKNSNYAAWPRLSDSRQVFAERFLTELRSRCQSPWARFIAGLSWLLTGKGTAIQIDGPFIPAERLVALMTLVIRVPSSVNYDAVYRTVHEFVDLHPKNDDREKFVERWNPRRSRKLATQPSRLEDGYSWSTLELSAVEHMAHLESGQWTPDHDISNDLATDAQRREHNQRMLSRARSRAEKKPAGAAGAATDQMRRIFFAEYE